MAVSRRVVVPHQGRTIAARPPSACSSYDHATEPADGKGDPEARHEGWVAHSWSNGPELKARTTYSSRARYRVRGYPSRPARVGRAHDRGCRRSTVERRDDRAVPDRSEGRASGTGPRDHRGGPVVGHDERRGRDHRWLPWPRPAR